MAQKERKAKKSRVHKQSRRANGGGGRMYHDVIETYPVKDKRGKPTGETGTRTRRRRGLNPMQKVLLVNGGRAHHTRRSKRRSVRV